MAPHSVSASRVVHALILTVTEDVRDVDAARCRWHGIATERGTSGKKTARPARWRMLQSSATGKTAAIRLRSPYIL